MMHWLTTPHFRDGFTNSTLPDIRCTHNRCLIRHFQLHLFLITFCLYNVSFFLSSFVFVKSLSAIRHNRKRSLPFFQPSALDSLAPLSSEREAHLFISITQRLFSMPLFHTSLTWHSCHVSKTIHHPPVNLTSVMNVTVPFFMSPPITDT